MRSSFRERRATSEKYLTETKEPEAAALLLAGAHWSLGSRVLRRKDGSRPLGESWRPCCA